MIKSWYSHDIWLSYVNNGPLFFVAAVLSSWAPPADNSPMPSSSMNWRSGSQGLPWFWRIEEKPYPSISHDEVKDPKYRRMIYCFLRIYPSGLDLCSNLSNFRRGPKPSVLHKKHATADPCHVLQTFMPHPEWSTWNAQFFLDSDHPNKGSITLW